MKSVLTIVVMFLQFSNTAEAARATLKRKAGPKTVQVTCERELFRPEQVHEAVSDTLEGLFGRPFVLIEVIRGIKPQAIKEFGLEPETASPVPNRIYLLERGEHGDLRLRQGDMSQRVWQTLGVPDLRAANVVLWRRVDVEPKELELEPADFLNRHFPESEANPATDSVGISAHVSEGVRRYILVFEDHDLTYLQLGLDVPCTPASHEKYGIPTEDDQILVRRADGEYCRTPILLLGTPQVHQ